jgi:polyhydroxyalkanoate synthesis regulator protein
MSIEQKIAEMLAESKAKQESTITEEVKEMGSTPDNAGKVKGNSAGSDPQPSITTDGVTTIDGEEEDNARNNAMSQDAATKGTPKSSNIANAKATAPEASHLTGMKEDIDAMLEGADLSEDFKTKAATIFEAAVLARVTAETAALEESYATQLQEEVESIKEGLVEKVDGYLGYIVEQWVQENELALESGMKSEIMESFIDGMKSLFAEHYIDVPEEKFDVLGDLQEQLNAIEATLNDQVEKNVELNKIVNEQKRINAIAESVKGLTDTEVEKFTALAEELSYDDADTFSTKLQTIRENYFGGKKVITEVKSVVSDTPIETLTEQAPVDPSVKKYLSELNKLK